MSTAVSRKQGADLQIVTANRLDDGRVVFRTPAGVWSPTFAEAAVLSPAEAAAVVAAASSEGTQVVGAYAVDISLDGPSRLPRPLRVRERIRLTGPSILAA